MTRHELKDQLQHDQFTDAVTGAVGFAASHKSSLIRWSIAAGAALALSLGIWWYVASQRTERQEELAAALSVVDAPVGAASEFAKTFPTEEAKNAAAAKALAEVASKYSGSREGLIAQYYLGTLKAQKSDVKGAETDLKTVADASSEVTPLAKIALAQLYMGEKKTAEAQGLLRGIVSDPSALVSKAQAQILLAQLDEAVNPKESKSILRSIDLNDQKRPAVKSAADALNSQLSK